MSHGQVTNLPHSVPIEQSTFVSSHDSFYQRPNTSIALTMKPKPKVPLSGHMINGQKPLRSLTFGRNVSTAHATFGKGELKVGGSGDGATAHVRNQSKIGSNGPAEPMVSTAKASFAAPGQAPHLGGRDFRYAGDSTVKYNPGLLRIDQAPTIVKEKPTIPLPPCRPSKARDGLHTNPGAKLDVIPKPPHVRPARMKGTPAMLHKTLEASAAAKMGGNTSQVGCFDENFQGTTTYRHFMLNPSSLPEPADCVKKQKGKTEDLVRLNHVEVDYSAARALNSVRGFDGTLVAERPQGVHPTIWRLEQEKERSKI